MKNTREGSAATASIQRQLESPSFESCQLTRYADKIPTTMASWFNDTSVPRFFDGAISAMYTGVKAEAKPMARPPAKRATENIFTVLASAEPRADTEKSSAANSRDFFRPYRSLTRLAPAAPIRQPSSSELAATSVSKLERANCLRRKNSTPLITAVSNPNRNPEIAAIVA